MPFITKSIKRAISDIEKGNPVAIPTETVYGLAAVIDHPKAIERVFSMKGRPLTHPLIVHVHADWDIYQLVRFIPDYAQKLMRYFWPGPLTLVLPVKKGRLHRLITGNQPTVAIRCPAHPIAQQLLKTLNTPVVAPSANPFGKISPTTALHVHQAFSDTELVILDGGRCEVGIESTIIDATEPNHYQILRHGLIGEPSIKALTDTSHTVIEHSIRVPGALNSHYQPQKKLYYFEEMKHLALFCKTNPEHIFVLAREKPPFVDKKHFYSLSNKPEEMAFELYYQLRKADQTHAQCIAIELPPQEDAWLGIRERILKAGTPYEER